MRKKTLKKIGWDKQTLFLYSAFIAFMLLYILFQHYSFSFIFGLCSFATIIIIIIQDFKSSVKETGYKKAVFESLIIVIGVIAFWFILGAILGTATPLDVVPSCSMLPNLQRGDMIVLQKANLNALHAPIVNVSAPDFNNMIHNINSEFLMCLAYNTNTGYLGESYNKGDAIGLFNIASTPFLVSQTYQSQNLIQYYCAVRNITTIGGGNAQIAYTTGISINGTNIIGDKNNGIVVYQTTPQDTFYKDGDIYIVHRAYAIINASGTYYVLTKGDNNNGLDIQDGNLPAKFNATLDNVVTSIPYLGYIKLIFSTQISQPAGCNTTIEHQW